MVFMDGPNKGLQKGLRAVCLERFGEQMVTGEFEFFYSSILAQKL